MIPEFPNFKPIELSDKAEVEKITHKYPPYSDFNFISMWSWDTKGEMRLSMLNNNLVVRFTDYITGEPFYSFLGDNKVNETTEKLLELSKKEGLKLELKLVPEISIENLDKNKFKIEEDHDNFDHLFDLELVSEYKGKKFEKKRNKTKIFKNKHKDISVEIVDFKNSEIQKKILSLNDEWLKNKKSYYTDFDIDNEFVAVERFLKSSDEDMVTVALFVGGEMVAYSVSQFLTNNHAVSHFSKSNINFKGAYEYLIKEKAKILLDKKYLILNFEQDLGKPGLRENKRSFSSNFLNKYKVSFVD